MFSLLRSLLSPFICLIFWSLATGFFNTFVSLKLGMAGVSTEGIGGVTSALYGGILLASLGLSSWISKTGHVRSFAIFAFVTASAIIAQLFWINPWYWGALRFIQGFCLTGVFIVIESWFLLKSPPSFRGKILSVYLAVYYAALSAGQLFVQGPLLQGPFPYLFAALGWGLSVPPLLFLAHNAPELTPSPALSPAKIFRTSPLGFFGGVISGMLLATVYGLVPLYGRHLGLSIPDVGTLMAILIFGGLSLQWPVGMWADRSDRKKVLSYASLASAFFALLLSLHLPYSLLLLFAWGFGGFSFTLYALSMAYACEKFQEEEIVAATGGFVLSYGSGAVLGPLIAPLWMDHLGPTALFLFLALITALLGLSTLPWRKR